MKINFTNEVVFSFNGPNLCLLGSEDDFRKLAESILDLTDGRTSRSIELLSMDFIVNDGEEKRIIFSSKKDASLLGVFDSRGDLIFELDPRYWERIFKYFSLMAWHKRTYYLNIDESYLDDLELQQQCNFICSSEF